MGTVAAYSSGDSLSSRLIASRTSAPPSVAVVLIRIPNDPSSVNLLLSRHSLSIGFRQMGTVNTHSGTLAPSLFVIPELDRLEGTFAEEVDHVVLSSGRNPLADNHFLRSATIEVNDQAVKKKASPLTRN